MTSAEMTASPATRARFHGADFVRLWSGQAVSAFGTRFTGLALPLIAVLLLHASAEQMGDLTALSFLPFVLAPIAGAFVDRSPKRRVLIVTDAGRALTVAAVPALALVGRLRIVHLYAFSLVIGVLTAFFMVAYTAFLPVLVPRDELVGANSKLQSTEALAQAVGPSVAGPLVQLIGAPLTMVVDALSYVVSAMAVWRVRTPEPVHDRGAERAGIVAEIREGLEFVWRHRLLRALTFYLASINACGAALLAEIVFYWSRELHLGAAVIGEVQATMGAGAILGALLAPRLTKRLGIGPTLIVATLVAGGAGCMIPVVGTPGPLATAIQFGAQLVVGMAFPLVVITSLSLVQSLTPLRLQARMIGTMRLFTWGIMPVAAFAAGRVAERFGVRLTLAAAMAGFAASALWVVLSPLRTLSTAPSPRPEAAEAA